MYAVIRTGGKQYTVKPGDIVHVEKLENDLGSKFDLTEILMLGGATPIIGKPTIAGAKVTVVVTKQAKTRKIVVFKKKRRHSYRNFNTHRQEFTALFIESITSPDGKVLKTDEKPNVKDMTAIRADRISAKQAVAQDRREGKEAAPAKKAAAPKKSAKAAGKTGAKKTAKTKTSGEKKTTKKA